MVTMRIRGADLTARLFVAFWSDLHSGHMYLFSFVSLSTEKKLSRASWKVHSLLCGKGKLRVSVSSNVSLR